MNNLQVSTQDIHQGSKELDKKLDIVVDGIIYSSQKAGGISRLFSEIMPRICDYDPDIHFKILMNSKNIQPPPRHVNITYQSTYVMDYIFRPWRFWKTYLPRIKNEINSMVIGESQNKIWHSTYFTLPHRWHGLTIVTVHDMIHEIYREQYFSDEFNDRFRDRKREAILCADKIISVSHATKEDVKKYFGVADEKIHVIANGCSSLYQKIDPQNASKKPFLLYVGKRDKHKNFEGLLYAYSLWAKNKEVDLVAAGPDWSKEESKKLIELNLQEQVRLIPYPNDITLRDLYNQALAFVFPSLYEGFGIPLLEAMACGCTVIASRIPSTVEVAKEIPVYHDPGNQEQLLANLNQVYDEPKSNARVLAGIELAKSFSWGRTARQTADLYRELAG